MKYFSDKPQCKKCFLQSSVIWWCLYFNSLEFNLIFFVLHVGARAEKSGIHSWAPKWTWRLDAKNPTAPPSTLRRPLPLRPSSYAAVTAQSKRADLSPTPPRLSSCRVNAAFSICFATVVIQAAPHLSSSDTWEKPKKQTKNRSVSPVKVPLWSSYWSIFKEYRVFLIMIMLF